MTQKIFFSMSVFVIVVTLTLEVTSSLRASSVDAYQQAEIIAEIRNKILNFYVEDVDSEKLMRGALDGMVSVLDDPYAAYLDEEDYKKIFEGTEGEFIGIGIEISVKDNFITVVSPIEGSPASKAGILAEDKILEIDGKSAEGITIEEAVDWLRGKVGTTVKLRILHSNSNISDEITVVRGRIELKSVKNAHIIDPEHHIGYIRLTRFNKHTYDDLKENIEVLRNQGMENLILDLRFNPGGLLTASVDVVNAFISEGNIVHTKGRIKQNQQTYSAAPDKVCWTKPMVIVVNRGSASASEIVAGALQDYHRAVIIGNRTYGKGSVQSILPLRDEKRGLKITTAKYYTPSGRSIQKGSDDEGGITPDVLFTLSTEEQRELIRSFSQPGNNLNDKQIQKAIEVMKKP